MTSIVRYGRTVRAFDPPHSGLVTLQGAGGHELTPTIGATGREVMPVIQGDNPATS
ncbi:MULTISPECIES: hypothetical protein [Streptomyces]|uniref:Uncharacterized protein n=1 Tax=Streptomyces sviceus (strain ATCC 29083 / DSM 924 / JCM 4929 / NBRC 13980 / NCIMB 11184 / NRRL 5439 / UC 5370) TaxID=463191 RepID=B5HZS1_STRX2|nr:MULTISPECIES: hypothetical protein [Streptomyces]EDY58326.1 conserved hypothetical protein [Streptomyces sviceus ATCC 29083]MYT08118.1 hypothetical protein [Streptomyces sp. SID5470]